MPIDSSLKINFSGEEIQLQPFFNVIYIINNVKIMLFDEVRFRDTEMSRIWRL